MADDGRLDLEYRHETKSSDGPPTAGVRGDGPSRQSRYRLAIGTSNPGFLVVELSEVDSNSIVCEELQQPAWMQSTSIPPRSDVHATKAGLFSLRQSITETHSLKTLHVHLHSLGRDVGVDGGRDPTRW